MEELDDVRIASVGSAMLEMVAVESSVAESDFVFGPISFNCVIGELDVFTVAGNPSDFRTVGLQ